MTNDKSKNITLLIVTILFGGLGIHRFLAGKWKSGIIWLVTWGVFGIGWAYDIVVAVIKLVRYNNCDSAVDKETSNYMPPIMEMIQENTIKNEEVPKMGTSLFYQAQIDETNIENIRHCFIAFDVETSGLSPYIDRIVELGAVIFTDGKPEKRFSSLVNSNVSISPAATSVNHITNGMIASAPSEAEIYPKFLEFIGEAATGKIIMCAHNASFDFSFLSNTLERLGYDTKINYVDTLSLARKHIKNVDNYKQCTLEAYYGLSNEDSHRAVSDAENCGNIFYRLLTNIDEEIEKNRQLSEATTPVGDELFVCAFIQDKIEKRGGDISRIRYKRLSNGSVDVVCPYFILRFKFAKKGSYVTVGKSYCENTLLKTEPCSASESEGRGDIVRVYFSTVFELEPFADYFYDSFLRSSKAVDSYIDGSSSKERKIDESLRFLKRLSSDETNALLNEAEETYKKRKAAKEQQQLEEQRQAEEKARLKAEDKAKKEAERIAKKEALANKPKGKAVLQLDKDGTVIAEYETIADAAKAMNINKKSITDAANGKQKHAAGHCWKFKE